MIAANCYNDIFINRANTVKNGHGVGRTDHFANILEQKQNDFHYAEPENIRKDFQTAVDSYEEENKLTPDKIEREDDWRYMDESHWNKLMDYVDNYIDAVKEEMEKLEEKQEEVAIESANEAPADMKSIAASSAALYVAANGIAPAGSSKDSFLEKSSWTYELKTDD